MIRSLTLALLLTAPLLATALRAAPLRAQPTGRVSGTVTDPGERPIAGAEVRIGERRTQTDSAGAFRVDEIAPGGYAVSVRRIGYSPARSRLRVGTTPVEVAYVLVPATHLLPPVVTEATRAGIFGVVGDTAYRQIVGARVQLFGPQTRDVRTDSLGRFAFADAPPGQYLMRVTYEGYTERSASVDLGKGAGRDYVFLLAPTEHVTYMRENVTALDLAERMRMGSRRERFLASDLARYGADGGCNVASQIMSVVGRDPIIVIHGLPATDTDLREELCATRLDELELIEFGHDVCNEVTLTVAELASYPCPGAVTTPRVTFNANGAIGYARRKQPPGYVVIWARR